MNGRRSYARQTVLPRPVALIQVVPVPSSIPKEAGHHLVSNRPAATQWYAFPGVMLATMLFGSRSALESTTACSVRQSGNMRRGLELKRPITGAMLLTIDTPTTDQTRDTAKASRRAGIGGSTRPRLAHSRQTASGFTT